MIRDEKVKSESKNFFDIVCEYFANICLKNYPFLFLPPSKFIRNYACSRYFFKKLLFKKLTSALTSLNLIFLALMNNRINLLS